MHLSQLHLTIGSIAEKLSSKDFQVVDVRISHVYDQETKQQTEAVDKIIINVLGYRGSTPSIKLPASLQQKALELKEKLETSSTLRISFENLRIKAYAMQNAQGSLISGVSCSADDFLITQCDEDDLEGLEL